MADRQKITHLTTLDLAGAGKAALRIVQALRHYDTDATLLCLHNRLGEQEGLVRYEVPKNSLWKRLWHRLIRWEPDYVRIRKMLSPYKVLDGVSVLQCDLPVENEQIVREAEVLHLHWVYQFVDLERFLNKTRQPVVWTLHDMGSFAGCCNYYYYCTKYREGCGSCPALSSDDANDLSRQLYMQKSALYKKHLKRLHIVTPSRWLAECARESLLLKEADIRVIPNCIDVELFRPARPVPSRVIRLLLGAMNAKDRNKGYERLLRSVEQLVERLPNAKFELLIVGADSEAIEMSERVKVRPFGFVSDDKEMVKIYQQADLLLYGSYRDNLPNMIMEAMACGVPVVAYPVGGVPEMVEHKQTGWLAKSEADYVDGIDWCLDNRDELSANARQKVLRDYHPQVVAEKYKQLYQEISRL